MLSLAFRNLFRHAGRTALTLSVIVFGVVGVIISGGFVQDVFVQLREFTIHSRLGHIQVFREGFETYGRRQPHEYVIEEPDVVAARIAELPHVSDVMQRQNFSGLLGNGRSEVPVIGEGVEPERESRLGSQLQLLSGRALRGDDQYAIMLGEGVASGLAVAPGNWVTLVASTADGAMNVLEFEVVGVFRSFSREFDARAVRVPLDSAKELLDSDAVHALVVALARTEFTDATAAAAARLVDDRGLVARTWHELDDFYPKTVALYQRQFGVLQLIILGMVLLGVSNSVNMAAFERIGEFGTLRALGQRNRRIAGLLILENALLGLMGAALGVVLGVGIAMAVSAIGIPMPPPPGSNTGYVAEIRVVPEVLVLAFGIGAVATVLSALLPARRVAQVPIADALRRNV